MQPLPAERYDLSQWTQARVNIDYHVAFDGNWYSVPYTLTGEAVEVRSTPATVEIFHRGKRVASHLRSRGPEQEPSPQHEHRPQSHQAHLEWPPSRMIEWAAKVGPHTAQLVERILESTSRIRRWATGRVWALSGWQQNIRPNAWRHAAERALSPAPSVTRASNRFCITGSIRSRPCRPPPPARLSPDHENLRGPEYFQ